MDMVCDSSGVLRDVSLAKRGRSKKLERIAGAERAEVNSSEFPSEFHASKTRDVPRRRNGRSRDTNSVLSYINGHQVDAHACKIKRRGNLLFNYLAARIGKSYHLARPIFRVVTQLVVEAM